MSVVPTKKEVAVAIVRAKTQEEIEAAQKLRAAYLQANPDDADILEMGETLSLLSDALKPKTPSEPGKLRTHNGVTESKRQ